MNNFLKHIILFLTFSVFVISCTKEITDDILDIETTENSIEVESISVNENEINLLVGDEFLMVDLIDITILPDNASDTSVKWESLNTEIATVNEGKIYGISVGEASITVTSVSNPEFKETILVNVVEEIIKIESIEITGALDSMNLCTEYIFDVNVEPENAFNYTVSWSIDDTSVATVITSEEEQGLVTGTLSSTDVTLTATIIQGDEEYSTSVDILFEENELPFAIIEFFEDIELTTAPLEINFSTGATDLDGEIVNYQWYLDSEELGKESSQNISFEIGGDFTIELLVTDNCGDPTSTSIEVTIKNNTPPEAIITEPVSGVQGYYAGDPFFYNGHFSTDEDIGDTTLTYQWYKDNEEEAFSTDPNVTVIFSTAGEHTIRLVVSDGKDTSEAIRTVNVAASFNETTGLLIAEPGTTISVSLDIFNLSTAISRVRVYTEAQELIETLTVYNQSYEGFPPVYNKETNIEIPADGKLFFTGDLSNPVNSENGVSDTYVVLEIIIDDVLAFETELNETNSEFPIE